MPTTKAASGAMILYETVAGFSRAVYFVE